jgi:hypothetical protein
MNGRPDVSARRQEKDLCVNYEKKGLGTKSGFLQNPDESHQVGQPDCMTPDLDHHWKVALVGVFLLRRFEYMNEHFFRISISLPVLPGHPYSAR